MQSDGSIKVDDVSYLHEQEGVYRPLARKTGEFVALAYSGGDIVDAVPISFMVKNAEEQIELGLPELSAVDIINVQLNATGAIDRIDVVDNQMIVKASLVDFPTENRSRARFGQRLLTRYPWIDILGAQDRNSLIDAAAPSGLMTLNSDELSSLEALLDKMPRRLVSAIDTFGVGSLSAPGLANAGHVFIDTAMFGNSERGRLYWVLVHEAAHAYHNLSGYGSGAEFSEWASEWPAHVVAAVRQTHSQFGFERDVLTFWQRLHEAAVDENLAPAYTNSDTPLSLTDPYREGFVTEYSSKNLTEDFADTVAIANFEQVQKLSPQLSANTCSSYQLNGLANIPINQFTALAYAKLRLVQAMGLAEIESVDWCVGNVTPIYEDGIKLGEAIHFDRELNAGYTGSDKAQFNIVGQDAENRGLAIELQTDGRHPVGIYTLDLTWWGSWDGSNTLVIASPDDFEARSASSGVVVITLADSTDKVEGFVLNLHLFSALGPASSFSFVPFRIPL
ncbi:MAG: hypothetical protein V3U76_16155 [Granulosicoccus sp.]